jgi:glyoxylase-like metal-dependent hydrolase (beta-lactamase superfamily II)
MLLFKFACGPIETNAILFGEGGRGAAIDPSLGSAEKIVAQAKQSGLKIEKILLTHSHWDHIADVHVLKEKTGALLYVHLLDAKNVEAPGSDGLPLYFPIPPTQPDHLLHDGEIVRVGSLQLEVIHTPGHTPGGVCFYQPSHGILFAGDTLFCGSMGRLDLPTGNAEQMWLSLRKLAKLPPKTRVISGHGPDTEIGKEAWLAKAEELFS